MDANCDSMVKTGVKLRILADALSQVMAQCPESPAVMQGTEVRSYRQLIDSSQHIAHQLHRFGVTAGQRLALSLPRSIALYELILGCLIAEVSFVSLPRGLEASKQLEIAKKANCMGIVSNTRLFPSDGPEISNVGHFWKFADATQRVVGQGDDAGVEIYCVRTSGTTGDPKIVPIHSRQLSAFLENAQHELRIADYAKWSWIHDLSFDFSIGELFGCLSHCGCLVVVEEDTKRDAQATRRVIANMGVNILLVTPSEFRYIFLHNDVPSHFDDFNLADIVFCGEKLTANTFLPIFDALKRADVRLINTYGPSEATVFCSSHLITEQDLELESIPIGKPFPGMVFTLVSANDSGAGELNLFGPQVFAGYEGGPFLTDGYDTKDICQIDEQGRFVYVGRLGGYQKINGFRVEPYEIAQYLESLPHVDEAVVWVENSGDVGAFLQAHIRVSRNAELSTRELRLACAKLPPYLRPTQYLLFKDTDWPVNSRGKTDCARLRRIACEQA